jgi:aryl-alcohol dehydrogenase-like predicted oxidoreductase
MYKDNNPYRFMVRPYNITTKDVAPVFAVCKRLGWENYACSPFVRGWELDRMVQTAKAQFGDQPRLKEKMADLMLRYSLFQPNVDRLIVAIRRVEWVSRNVSSYHKGPLTEEERTWLENIWATQT